MLYAKKLAMWIKINILLIINYCNSDLVRANARVRAGEVDG